MTRSSHRARFRPAVEPLAGRDLPSFILGGLVVVAPAPGGGAQQVKIREAAGRAQSANNLKQMSLGMASTATVFHTVAPR